MELLTAMLTMTAGAGSWAAVTGGRRIVRRRAIAQRLAQLDVSAPLDTQHLPLRLGALVHEARGARRALETPLARALAVPRTPWAAAGVLQDYDLSLTAARRALWDWMCAIRGLGAADIAVLRELGLDPRPLRRLLYMRGLFDRGDQPFDGWLPIAPDLDHVTEGLCEALEHLRHFEVALLAYRPDPYR